MNPADTTVVGRKLEDAEAQQTVRWRRSGKYGDVFAQIMALGPGEAVLLTTDAPLRAVRTAIWARLARAKLCDDFFSRTGKTPNELVVRRVGGK